MIKQLNPTRCYLCLTTFKSPAGLKIHEEQSLEHFKRKLDLNDPNRVDLRDYFEEEV